MNHRNDCRNQMLERVRVLIQSTCDLWGSVIVGSLLENLLQDERDHRAKCSRPLAKSGSAGE
jgi:hypothetical protein